MQRKTGFILLGILAVAIVFCSLFLSQISINPTDIKIIKVLEENKQSLLNIQGVIGAGIAKDEINNQTIGIAVYVENSADTENIPGRLGEFEVFIKNTSQAAESEKQEMIIASPEQDNKEETYSCTDSDGGKDYYKKGSVPMDCGECMSQGCACGIEFDYCKEDGKTLVEYYCINNTSYKSEEYPCPNGCENRACM